MMGKVHMVVQKKVDRIKNDETMENCSSKSSLISRTATKTRQSNVAEKAELKALRWQLHILIQEVHLNQSFQDLVPCYVRIWYLLGSFQPRIGDAPKTNPLSFMVKLAGLVSQQTLTEFMEILPTQTNATLIFSGKSLKQKKARFAYCLFDAPWKMGPNFMICAVSKGLLLKDLPLTTPGHSASQHTGHPRPLRRWACHLGDFRGDGFWCRSKRLRSRFVDS